MTNFKKSNIIFGAIALVAILAIPAGLLVFLPTTGNDETQHLGNQPMESPPVSANPITPESPTASRYLVRPDTDGFVVALNNRYYPIDLDNLSPIDETYIELRETAIRVPFGGSSSSAGITTSVSGYSLVNEGVSATRTFRIEGRDEIIFVVEYDDGTLLTGTVERETLGEDTRFPMVDANGNFIPLTPPQ